MQVGGGGVEQGKWRYVILNATGGGGKGWSEKGKGRRCDGHGKVGVGLVGG